MKQSFEETLNLYAGKLKQKEGKPQEIQGDVIEHELFDVPLKDIAAAMARQRLTPERMQAGILDIQRRKRKAILRMRRELAAEDHPRNKREADPSERRVEFDDGKLWWIQPDETRVPLTEGDILTDGEWGIRYYLDPSVPVHLRKRYVVENAKRELRVMLNQQIRCDERMCQTTPENIQSAYRGARPDSLARRAESSGWLAETMVYHFLNKLCINHGLDFNVRPGDLHEDLEEKADIVIEREERARGIRVKESKTAKSIGIQLTITQSPGALQIKLKKMQDDRAHLPARPVIEDVWLVSLPVPDCSDLYKVWLQRPMTGGPDGLWDSQTRETIFRLVLQGFLTPEEIDEQWQKTGGGNNGIKNSA